MRPESSQVWLELPSCIIFLAGPALSPTHYCDLCRPHRLNIELIRCCTNRAAHFIERERCNVLLAESRAATNTVIDSYVTLLLVLAWCQHGVLEYISHTTKPTVSSLQYNIGRVKSLLSLSSGRNNNHQEDNIWKGAGWHHSYHRQVPRRWVLAQRYNYLPNWAWFTGLERRGEIHSTLLLFTTVHTAGYLSVDFAQSSFAETVENRIDNHHHNQDHGDDDDHFHSGLKSWKVNDCLMWNNTAKIFCHRLSVPVVC